MSKRFGYFMEVENEICLKVLQKFPGAGHERRRWEMFHCISTYFCDLLDRNEMISDDERELYLYGFEITLANVTGVLIAFLIGMLSGYLIEVVLFLLVIVSLRLYCGGYHAKTHVKCLALFSLTCVLGLLLGEWFSQYGWLCLLYLFSALVLALCIYKKVPVENECRPLTVDEKVDFRKRSWGVYFFWLIAGGLLYGFQHGYLLSILSMAFISVSVMIIIARKEDNNETKMSSYIERNWGKSGKAG